MSLVAYGASDDSDVSDNEGDETAEVEKVRDDPISDEEDGIPTTNSGFSTGGNSSTTSISKSIFDSGLFKTDLPPTNKTENAIIEEAELEEEVRQKPSELADAPKPPPKRTKQPVKITIPSLNDIPDEEEAEGKQKPVASSVRSGLFSLLPAPIHSTKKEINRPLIPHSLGKRTPTIKPINAQAKPSQMPTSSSGSKDSSSTKVTHSTQLNKNAAVQSVLGQYGSDSSDDDDRDESNPSQNFFSLGSKTLSSAPDTDSKVVKTTTKTGDTTVEEKGDGQDSEVTASTASASSQEHEIVALPEPGLTNDLPLSFSNPGKTWSAASSSGYHRGLEPSHQAYTAYPQSGVGHVSSVQYNMADSDDVEPMGQMDVADDELQKMMGDKEFQKLNNKRKRGMEEAINFVDAKVDDYVDPSELSKHMTEETEYSSSSSSKKNKDDMPTSQQKRKKQITYLAFQAKEQELELKNSWANNKMTRRQTQAKYGF